MPNKKLLYVTVEPTVWYSVKSRADNSRALHVLFTDGIVMWVATSDF